MDSTGAASTFSASIVKTTYGVDVAPDNDKNVALMEKVLQSVQAFAPGRFLVQYFPVLGHVPTWFPVAGPQLLELAPWRAAAREVKQAMYEKTKEDIVSVRFLRICDIDRRLLGRNAVALARRCCPIFSRGWMRRAPQTRPKIRR